MLTEYNGILIGLVGLTSLGVMVYWHVTTSGRWWRYVSGKSLMGLLGIITAITALATFSIFYGPFAAREAIYAVFYSLLEVALILVGVAVIGAQRSRGDRSEDDDRTNHKENSHD